MKKLLVFVTLFSYQLTFGQAANPQTITTVTNTPWGATATTQTTNFASNAAGQTYVNGAAANAGQAKQEESLCGPQNMMSCIIAATAIIQVGVMVAGYLDSKKTKGASDCQGAFCGNSTTTDTGSTPGTPTGTLTYNSGDPNDPMNNVVARAQSTSNALKAKGYDVNVADGSVTTPSGKKMSSAEMASAASGMSPEEAAKHAEIAAQAMNDVKKSNADFEGSSETGGGKKSGGGGGDGSSAGFDMNAYMKNLMGNNSANRGVAGLSVKAGNDNIGVRQSNIFEQASRAYSNDKVLTRTGP